MRWGWLTIGVWLVCAAPVSAQTILASTLLNATITATQTTLVAVSPVGFVVNNYVFAEGEAMQIRAVVGTTITVTRGVLSTRGAAHAVGAALLTGVAAHFVNMGSQHTPPIGYCVRAAQLFLPLIDVTSGNIWTCNASNQWVGTNVAKLTYNSLTSN